MRLFWLLCVVNAKGPGGYTISREQQSCADSPCANGSCFPTNANNRGFLCSCSEGFTGIYCDIKHPTVTCGKSSMEVSLDKRMVTEHGLEDNVDQIGFLGVGEGCEAVDNGDSYTLKIDSPFSSCGTTTSHSGEDFEFSNAVVWRQTRESSVAGDAPVVTTLNLLKFKCTYEDKYELHLDGPIKPAVTTVDAKTGYGDFQVDMGLYKDRTFSTPYPVDPVVHISKDVCVQLQLKDSVRDDLVLTANDCWASSQPDGSGQRYDLISKRCGSEDDLSMSVVMNGVSNYVQYCFQMFKWEDEMDQVYLQCNVTVCHKGEGGETCICRPENVDYDAYYYVNYYYANYMETLYDQWKTEGENGETRKRREDVDVDADMQAGAGEGEAELTDEEKEAKQKRIEVGKKIMAEKRAKAEAENAANSFNAVIGWKIFTKQTEEEMMKNSEIARPSLEIEDPAKLDAEVKILEKENKNQILMIIGIALCVSLALLGVCIGIYVQYRRKASVQRRKNQEFRKVKEFYQGVLKPYHHPRHLPHQGQDQPPPYTATK